LLNDPNIWIRDTAARVHISPYKHGMIPETKSEKHGSITIGNRISDKMVMYGDIVGTVCNKKGVMVGWVKLTHMGYSPGLKFFFCFFVQTLPGRLGNGREKGIYIDGMEQTTDQV
jgi:hypothetical protein